MRYDNLKFYYAAALRQDLGMLCPKLVLDNVTVEDRYLVSDFGIPRMLAYGALIVYKFIRGDSRQRCNLRNVC